MPGLRICYGHCIKIILFVYLVELFRVIQGIKECLEELPAINLKPRINIYFPAGISRPYEIARSS